MVDNILATNVTLEKSDDVWFEISGRDNQSAFIHRAVLASSLSALALSTYGEKRDGVILAAIAAGLKVVRR